MPDTDLEKLTPDERHRKLAAQRFTVSDAFRIFCVWMRCGRNATEAARITGHSAGAVKTLAQKGRPRLGVKPFAEMAEALTPYARNAVFPEPIEEFIRAIWEMEWSEDKIVRTVLLATWLMQVTAAETFATTKGILDQPQKTIELAKDTLDVLAKCADIEERYMKRARKLGLKFGDGTGGQVEDLSKLSTEQLRKRVIEARAVESKGEEKK